MSRCLYSGSIFLSTPSARRATSQEPALAPFSSISIHALREEGDHRGSRKRWHREDFYPRPPRGGRRAPRCRRRARCCHFYPRPPRGGRHGRCVQLLNQRIISIHALREEGDPALARPSNALSSFLSTPSARRATKLLTAREGYLLISIHALREEGDRRD